MTPEDIVAQKKQESWARFEKYYLEGKKAIRVSLSAHSNVLEDEIASAAFKPYLETEEQYVSLKARAALGQVDRERLGVVEPDVKTLETAKETYKSALKDVLAVMFYYSHKQQNHPPLSDYDRKREINERAERLSEGMDRYIQRAVETENMLQAAQDAQNMR